MGKLNIFRKCPSCQVVWTDRTSFLKDKTLQLNGYQVDFEKIDQGLFYFTHRVDGCYSTMVIEAGRFFDLNPGVRHKERNTGKDGCPGYCLKKDQLDRCDAICECAFVRDVIDIVRNYKDNQCIE